MQAHPAGAGLPEMPLGGTQPGQFLPALPRVRRAEQGGVFHAGIDAIRVGQRRLEQPDPFELPRVLRAIVPLVRSGNALIGKPVAHCLPGQAAIAGALDHLSGPAVGLGCIQSLGIGG